ncbi:uracil-DNA glycosylase-like [Sinocyclocheilus grahami]|uniref:uracil-DNA glycosylase-like n=1 Tax=Sinocyclocheilus grahami TaxID=75366 RepID=UPI0007AC9ACA|nr:PREDICTED: uracil-DNA glycosylase-like [Sinocyclocheilus grahami]
MYRSSSDPSQTQAECVTLLRHRRLCGSSDSAPRFYITCLNNKSAWRLLQTTYISFIFCSVGKKQKLESGDVTRSPEQLQRISRNRAAALERLAGNQALPSGFGESWKAALSAELGKRCFRALMSFVAEERQKHTIYPPPDEVFTWTQAWDIKDVSGCHALMQGRIRSTVKNTLEVT